MAGTYGMPDNPVPESALPILCRALFLHAYAFPLRKGKMQVLSLWGRGVKKKNRSAMEEKGDKDGSRSIMLF